MTDLRDERNGPPLKVAWATDRVHEMAANSFAIARAICAAVTECEGRDVRCRVLIGYADWRDEDGRRLEELSLAECRDLDYAWEHLALKTAVRLMNGDAEETEASVRAAGVRG